MEQLPEDRIIDDPYKAYADFHARLMNEGPNAPFPEFKPTIDFLTTELGSDEIRAVLAAHPDLSYEYTEVKTLLAHVNLTFTVDVEDYPYAVPFTKPFPYRPTIDAVEAALRLLDKLNRLMPGSKAVALYHFDRYAYHRHSLVADPDLIIFPTIRSLDYYDLIRVRPVPIGFVGVVARTLRVDRHQQSPLDFWYHDLNHVRRMFAYTMLRARTHNALTDKAKLEFFAQMDRFTTGKILPAIAPLPEGSDPKDIAVRRLVRIVLFEILHETALTPERETIINDLLRGSGPQPFEHMLAPGESMAGKSIEELRTPTGNVQSGTSRVTVEGNAPITIRYFYDRALALLANVYNKLNFGFYDDPDHPDEFTVPINFRKPEHIVAAAKEIFQMLEVEDMPSDETLLSLVTTREGSEEKFVYKGIRDEDMAPAQQATDPLPADEIIAQVKALGKRVYTLFGYSLLDYERKEAVMEQIRTELSALDPSTTVINIGATEDGIGAAYEIAKELGFETIGIVSTQALFYSGKFSRFVDRIYIINDSHWGGYVPGSGELAETTKAFLAVSDVISAYGGGGNTAATLIEAKKRGILTNYIPAEMNHEIARKQGQHTNAAGEEDYKGLAYYAWVKV